MVMQTSAPRKRVSIPACDPIPLGDRRYRVPSSTNPCVCYVVDLDAGTCGCPHYTHRQTPCKHMRRCDAVEKDIRATTRQASASMRGDACRFNERGEYTGPLADAFGGRG